MAESIDEAARAVADPGTDAATLARIAYAHPSLGAQVARHPNAYPELVAWIGTYSAQLQHAPASVSTPVATPMGEPTEPHASSEQTPRRRSGLFVGALIAVAAMAVLAGAGTGAMAVMRLAEQGSVTHPSSQGAANGSSPEGHTDPAATSRGLPDTDTASGASDLAASVEGADTGPIMLILDASGSMVRDTTTGRTRMDDARDAMSAAIDMLPDDAEVGLLVFGTGTGNSDAERAQGCQDVKTVHELGALDRPAMQTSVKGVKASGFTPLGPSLRMAADMLPASGPATIVLVSDGVDTCSPPPACEVASELRSHNPGLTIHAVGFAIDDDEQAQQQLQCVGRVGGGGFVSAANVHQLGARIAAAAGGADAGSVLTDGGFRGIRLGMTLDEVLAYGDGAEVSRRETDGGIEYVVVDCAWGAVELRGGLVVAIRPADEAATLDGLAVGDPVDDVARLYGDAIDEGSDDDGAFRVYPVSAGGINGYKVYTSESKVTRIVLCRCVPFVGAGEYSTWEITYDGVGPIRLGMTVDEVVALLPGATPVQGEDEVRTWTPLHDQPWLRVEIVGDEVVKIGVTTDVSGEWRDELALGSTLPHMRGIRAGDTMTTARNVVPGGTQFSLLGRKQYVVATRTGTAIVFRDDYGDEGRIAAMSVVRAGAASLYYESEGVLETSVSR